jgi:hypothetical protein
MLKLKAETPEDIAVFSIYLQDAALKVEDFAYIPSQNRLALVCNRFMWEHEGEKNFRTRTGLHFNLISACNVRNIPLQAKTQVLELLALHAVVQDSRVLINLAFSGGGDIRLEAELIDAYLEDIGQPWETKNRPDHDGDA